jgi:hypothetical protein
LTECRAVVYDDLVIVVRSLLRATVVLVIALASTPARAGDEPVAKPAPAAEAADADLPAGSPMSWPKGKATGAGSGPRLVWTGFQMTAGGSRLVLQTTADVELAVHAGKGGLTVTLQNCRIYMRNAGRPLDTSFFRSPVKLVSVHQRKKDIEVDVALREAADSTPRKVAGPNGSQFWILDFPQPKSAKTP